MVTEQQELQHIEDPAEGLPEARSLDSMRADLQALEDDALGIGDLEKARRNVDMQLRGVSESGDAWRAIVDEAEPNLDREERAAIQRLEGIRATVLADREALNDIPYRCGLPGDQAANAEAKAARLAQRLPSMAAVDVQRAIRGATLFGDRAEMAAWAMIGADIEARFPRTHRVRDENGREVYPQSLFGDPLRQCEAATGDRTVIETRDRLEGQLQRVNHRISAISQARNQHNPTGGVGGVLASWQFGRGGAEQVRQERRYDPAAVRARIGR